MDTKEEFMQPGKNNKEDRMNFVKFWARYIQTHSDEEWSNQQNKLINSQLQISRELQKNKKLLE